MPQLQLPIFPAGTTPITAELAFDCRDGKVTYVNGHLPVFQHGQEDLASFRLFTSQLASGERYGEPGGNCSSVSRAIENGEALREAIAGKWFEEFFRDTAETFGSSAQGRSKRAGANLVGRRAGSAGSGEEAWDVTRHIA